MLICCLCHRLILKDEKFDYDSSVDPVEDWHMDCSNVFLSIDGPFVSALDRPAVS